MTSGYRFGHGKTLKGLMRLPGGTAAAAAAIVREAGLGYLRALAGQDQGYLMTPR